MYKVQTVTMGLPFILKHVLPLNCLVSFSSNHVMCVQHPRPLTCCEGNEVPAPFLPMALTDQQEGRRVVVSRREEAAARDEGQLIQSFCSMRAGPSLHQT